MNKRVISLVVLVPFITVSLSCSYTVRKSVDSPSQWVGTRPTIVGVLTKTGESYEYSIDRPARIVGKNVVGRVVNRGEVLIDSTDVDDFAPAVGEIRQIRTTDGQIYDVIRRDGSTFVCLSAEERSIPLSDVDLLSIRTGSAAAGAIVAMVVVVGGFLLIAGSSGGGGSGSSAGGSGGDGSCPHVYSFDGERYIFDAEPFGGAICRAWQRTDWCCLNHLAEMNGTCMVMVTNELQETQFTDELGLLVIDHPPEVAVIPDSRGRIHTVGQLARPVRAVDEGGADITSLVSENDWISWTGTRNASSVAAQAVPRHELLFEFEKPKDATQAKLVLNACNSVWGSASLAHYLELHGNNLGAWYDAMNAKRATFFKTVGMHLREELFSLQIRVETQDGWESKGIALGGGPFASDDKVYCIDVSDIPGETLRLKLTPPPYYWMINYLGVDYSDNVPVTVTDLQPVTATDRDGRDVRSLLTASDDRYHVMESHDPAVNLLFELPTKPADMSRAFILKATGYYDIHVDADGEPDQQLLSRIEREPGFAVRYAAEQIEKWQEEALSTLASR